MALAIHPCIIEATRVVESLHPGDLDFKAFFLDHGVIAGKAPAVQLFLATPERLLREIGLVASSFWELPSALRQGPPLQAESLGKADCDIRHSLVWVVLWGAPCQMKT